MICISIVEPTAEKCLAALDGIGFAEIRIDGMAAVYGLIKAGSAKVTLINRTLERAKAISLGLVALACSCAGRSRIHGVGRLKHKESDRAGVLLKEFSGLGARISIVGEALEIEGVSLKGGTLDSHNDHRIAMAGAVAGLSSEGGVSVLAWECVSKSYPRFFEDLKSLGGDVS